MPNKLIMVDGRALSGSHQSCTVEKERDGNESEQADNDPYLKAEIEDLFGELRNEIDYFQGIVFDLGRLIERVLRNLRRTE